ncbi:MAG: helix-turn-helix domain-containing protein [Clostridiaceae bacterium]|jgi:IS30 family transposase|nr:helix-turn-helix domain-containing protein [Clostridiaceae bacterium]
MKEIHHLTLQDRQAIQSAIEEGKTKAEIGRLLGKDPCGISREIIRHREFKKRNTYNRRILCAKRKDCKIRKCSKTCNEYEEPTCVRRDRLPGVCNGCEKRAKCPMDKYFYHAARADSKYREELVCCREGINMEEAERNLIGEKKGAGGFNYPPGYRLNYYITYWDRHPAPHRRRWLCCRSLCF